MAHDMRIVERKNTKSCSCQVICQVSTLLDTKTWHFQQVPYLFFSIGLRDARPPQHSWHAISCSSLNITKMDKQHGCQFPGNEKRSSTSYDTFHSCTIHHVYHHKYGCAQIMQKKCIYTHTLTKQWWKWRKRCEHWGNWMIQLIWKKRGEKKNT